MKKILLWTVSIMIVICIGVFLYSRHIANLIPDLQETFILGPTELASDSQGTVRLWVQNYREKSPIENAEVKVTLFSPQQEIDLGKTTTDKQGNASIDFNIPSSAEGSYEIRVETVSSFGKDNETLNVSIKKDYKVLLNTDKPLYQPGQLIHIRSLVMNNFTTKPVQNEHVVVEVHDPKNNKVFKKELKTSNFGIAACDFQLASEINEGEYNLKVICDKVTQEKKLTVKRYVLPKFKVATTFSQNYFMPGQKVTAEINADYFFGEPVANARIEFTASTFDVNFNEIVKWQGITNEKGHCSVEFTIPEKLYGSELLKGNALITAVIKVTDNGNHTQSIAKNIVVSKDTINIIPVMASPNVVAAIPNTMYLCTTYPDGSPAVTTIEVNGEKVQTNSLGIAEVQVTPTRVPFSVTIKANDANGNTATATHNISSQQHSNFIAVMDKAIYKGGDTANLTILSPTQNSNFYVDLVKDRQSIVSYIVTKENDSYQKTFTLPQDITGTLAVNVYNVSSNNTITRDTRLIFVAKSDDLAITTSMDKDVYRPGDTATIDFETTEESALSISIVDESVFALQEMQPGLEKVYFMLQEELLKPRYQIRYAPPITKTEIVSFTEKKQDANDKNKEDVLKKAAEKEQAAKVMFAIASGVDEHTQSLNCYPNKSKSIEEHKRSYFDGLRQAITSVPFVLFLLICLVSFIVIIKRLITKDTVFYDKEDSNHQILSSFQFNYRMIFIFVSVFLLSVIFMDEFFRRGTALHACFFSSMLLFIPLFSVCKKEKLTLDNLYIVIAILIVMFVLFGASNGEQWRRRDVIQMVFITYLFGITKATMTLFYYGFIYTRQQKLLASSSFAVRSTMTFLATIILGIFATSLISTSRYEDRKWIEMLLIACSFAVLILIPLFSTYIRSFLYKTSKARILLATPMLVVILYFILPSNGMMHEKAARNQVAEVDWAMKQDGFNENTMEMEMNKKISVSSASGTTPTSPKKQIRIREFFPETLYWNPELLTEEKKAQIQIPVSDSITTFRMVCQGVSENGLLGSMTQGIRVFQDFFVDIDFPVSLTQNDIVSVPLQIYNYLGESQQVKLVLQAEDWFEVIGETEQEIVTEPRQVSVVYFRIRAKRVGHQKLTVMAYGSKMSDAIRRSVMIEPDGKKIEHVINATLSKSVTHQCTVPENSIAEASKIVAKCYPGVTSILVEGLDGMLRLPGG